MEVKTTTYELDDDKSQAWELTWTRVYRTPRYPRRTFGHSNEHWTPTTLSLLQRAYRARGPIPLGAFPFKHWIYPVMQGRTLRRNRTWWPR